MLAIDVSELNWLAIVVSIIAGQIISTIWFAALFGKSWARAYGVASQKEHTKAIPPYTYAVGLLCTSVLVLSIAILQQWLGIGSIGAAVSLGFFLAIGIAAATSLPGLAFLNRWTTFLHIIGSQTAMILGISIILAVWK